MNETQIEWTELLSKVDVLEPLSSEQLGWVAQKTLSRSFQKGESIYLPGDATEVVFLLLAGRVRLFAMVRQKELTFDVVQAGAIFGEASLMERTQNEYAQANIFRQGRFVRAQLLLEPFEGERRGQRPVDQDAGRTFPAD